jgi:hypothetical protein
LKYSSQALQKKPSTKASFYSTETTPETATMASFNFDKFDTEFEMKQMLRNAMEALDALRNPANANERLVPLEPGMPLQRLSQTCRTKRKPATKDERCSKISQNQPKAILRKKGPIFFTILRRLHIASTVEDRKILEKQDFCQKA